MDWNSFTLFDGPASLDSSILEVSSSVQNDIKRVHDWLAALHNNIETDQNHCGIPEDKVNDTKRLLDKFFPLEYIQDNNGNTNPTISPVGVASTTDGATYFADPVTNVQFGDKEFSINDGPAALGYIFSIQTKKPPSPTYEDYALPLLVLYGRCIFLIYLTLEALVFSKQLKMDKTTVPWTACVMYITNVQGDLPLFVGCTYVNGDAKNPNDKVGSAGRQDMMNIWRRNQAIDLGFKTLDPTNTLPDPSPRQMREIREALLSAFCGRAIALGGSRLYTQDDEGTSFKLWDFKEKQGGIIPKDVADEIFTTIEGQYKGLWKLTSPVDIVGAPRDDLQNMKDNPLPSTKHLRDLLHEKLQAIVDVRWGYGDTLDDSQQRDLLKNIEQPFKEFFSFYFVPHMFFKNPAALNPQPTPGQVPPLGYDLSLPEVSPDPSGTLTKQILEPLWGMYGGDAVALLNQIYWWVTRGDHALALAGSNTERFGRCAESYPVTALLPSWTSSRVLPDTSDKPVTPVRGFTMRVRRLHSDPGALNTNVLFKDFSSRTLNAFHDLDKSDALYALPCENCRTLLPAFDVPIGKSDYDADLWTIAPDQAAKL